MEFAAVREAVGVSDSVLSKHVKQLEEAGYVEVRKATIASRQRTSLALTKAGRAAFTAHVAELRRITGGGPAPQGHRDGGEGRGGPLRAAAPVAGGGGGGRPARAPP